jgi:hypothetical protein
MKVRINKTKIIATYGPACSALETMEDMVEAGVDGFRFNMSHGTHAQHIEGYNKVRQINNEHGLNIAILAWLPKERILAYADMFNWPAANAPVPDPPVIGTLVFLRNLDRLGIDPVGILSIHTMNPDRLVTVPEIRASVGSNKL